MLSRGRSAKKGALRATAKRDGLIKGDEKLSKTDRDLITGGNAAKLFKIKRKR